jgi:LacI family transcriptional regulator, galactose operon repressor
MVGGSESDTRAGGLMKNPKPAGSKRPKKPFARPTIRDVAQSAGVSVGTVSRVLNGNKTVGPVIRKRVERVIARLKFMPDAAAQGMRGTKRAVGIIIRDITVHALASFVKSAQRVFLDAGYILVIGCSEDQPKREIELLESLRRRLDGLIMSTASEDDLELATIRNSLEIPLVLLDRETDAEIDTVTMVQRDGTRKAVQYLLEMGHRDIALVTGPTTVLSARERILGYHDAFAEMKLPVNADLIKAESFTADYAYIAVSDLLGSRRRPTAIVAGGISMLTGMLRACSTERLRIPQDISIIGCGDSDVAELTSPPMTVIRWNYDSVGEAAAHLIIDRIKDPTLPTRRLRFPTELVIRGSCGPPPK